MHFFIRRSEEMTKAKYKSVQPANELKLQRPNVLCVFAGVNVHHSLYLTRNAQSATLILSLCVFLSLAAATTTTADNNKKNSQQIQWWKHTYMNTTTTTHNKKYTFHGIGSASKDSNPKRS